jgi:glycosyltransferase involved in cell wall biosynthesis
MLLDHEFNENVRIWPRGVDISLFSPISRSNDIRAQWLNDAKGYSKSVILYVGRVSFEKNIDLVIQAYKSMDHNTCHLVIVGHGPALNELQARCLKDELPVTFTGYLQGKQLSEVYASADIFAFPSITETFGQVVLEAMASGLPVVGLEAEGVVDLVTHEKTGLLLNTNGLNFDQQVVQYRHLLNRLILEKDTRLNMSKESMIKAKKYTWFEAMECMVNIYRDAIGGQQESEILIHEEQVDSGVEEDYFSDNKLSHL